MTSVGLSCASVPSKRTCKRPHPQSSYTRVWLFGVHASVLDFSRFSFHVPTLDLTWMSSAPAADARAKRVATTARLDKRRMNPPYWGELDAEPIPCTAARQPAPLSIPASTSSGDVSGKVNPGVRRPGQPTRYVTGTVSRISTSRVPLFVIRPRPLDIAGPAALRGVWYRSRGH